MPLYRKALNLVGFAGFARPLEYYFDSLRKEVGPGKPIHVLKTLLCKPMELRNYKLH